MSDFNAIKLIPIIGATLVGTVALYFTIRIVPNLHTETSEPLDDDTAFKGGTRKRRKSKRNV